MRKLLLVIALCLTPIAAFADLSVHILNVGYGNCVIVQCDGESAIIDGGSPEYSDVVFSVSEELGIDTYKYMFATVPADEHVGGLPAVFRVSDVQAMYVPEIDAGNDRHRLLVETANEYSTPIIIPSDRTELPLGSGEIVILRPCMGSEDTSDDCLLLLLKYGSTQILFCSDAGTAVEDRLKNYHDYNLFLVDIVMVGRHGSEDATSREFISYVHPQYAIVSCSESPDESVIEILRNVPTRMVRTNYNGNITITADLHDFSIISDEYYIGNKNSNIVHRPSCNSAEKIKDGYRIIFFSAEEAERRYYRPCKKCTPWEP